jgi:hypothetical protein
MARRNTKTAAVQVKAAVCSLPNVIEMETHRRRQTG